MYTNQHTTTKGACAKKPAYRLRTPSAFCTALRWSQLGRHVETTQPLNVGNHRDIELGFHGSIV
jgi:hypothetical protein